MAASLHPRLDRLIGGGKDVRFAGIELALYAPDDPVTRFRFHRALRRVYEHAFVIAAFPIIGRKADFLGPIPECLWHIFPLMGQLEGLDFDGSFPEFSHTNCLVTDSCMIERAAC